MKRDAVFVMLFVIVISLLTPTALMADGCRAVVVRQHHNVYRGHQVYQAYHEVAVAKVIPVVAKFLEIPLYSAQYAVAPYAAIGHGHAGYGAPAAPACADLAGVVKQLQEQVQALKAGQTHPVPQPERMEAPRVQAQAAGDRVAQLMTLRCAACHEEKIAKQTGGGLALTAGDKLKDYTAEQLGGIIKAVASKHMPLNRGMPELERLELIALLTGGQQASK